MLSKTAVGQLGILDLATANRVKKSLRLLEETPFSSRSGADIKKLHGSGEPSLYRLRVGDLRAIYCVVGEEVRVTEIARRSQAYKFLD